MAGIEYFLIIAQLISLPVSFPKFLVTTGYLAFVLPNLELSFSLRSLSFAVVFSLILSEIGLPNYFLGLTVLMISYSTEYFSLFYVYTLLVVLIFMSFIRPNKYNSVSFSKIFLVVLPFLFLKESFHDNGICIFCIYIYCVMFSESYAKKSFIILGFMKLLFVVSMFSYISKTSCLSDKSNIEYSISPILHQYPSLPYQNDWVSAIRSSIDNLDILNTSGCPLCGFQPLPGYGIPNSSPRDAIMLITFRELYTVVPLVRSLRTAGSKASIIFFTDTYKSGDWTNDFDKIASQCGIIPVQINGLDQLSQWQKQALRYPLLSDFLLHYRSSFRRLLYCDTYDTVFQADPFTDKITTNTLYISGEGYTYPNDKNGQLVYKWVKALNGVNPSYFDNLESLCSGMFLGAPDQIYALTSLVASSFGPNLLMETNDQGYYSVIVYSGILSLFGMKTHIFPPYGHLASIGIFRDGFAHKNGFGTYRYKNEELVPAVFHQYDRVKAFCHEIVQSCPKGDLNILHYLRGY